MVVSQEVGQSWKQKEEWGCLHRLSVSLFLTLLARFGSLHGPSWPLAVDSEKGSVTLLDDPPALVI